MENVTCMPSDPSWQVSDVADGSVALEPGRAWDLPAGARAGHGESLAVPVSEGPASFDFEPANVPPHVLMRQEPDVEPMRLMELGTRWTDDVRRRAGALDTPIVPPSL